jgi:hypothetical protein
MSDSIEDKSGKNVEGKIEKEIIKVRAGFDLVSKNAGLIFDRQDGSSSWYPMSVESITTLVQYLADGVQLATSGIGELTEVIDNKDMN